MSPPVQGLAAWAQDETRAFRLDTDPINRASCFFSWNKVAYLNIWFEADTKNYEKPKLKNKPSI